MAQELISADIDLSAPYKKPQKSLQTTKLTNYKWMVGDSVFWASRQAYLELVKSFLSKKINGETLTSKFFRLRSQDMIRTDELCAIIEEQILPIPDFYYTFKAKEFSSAIDELYLEIDLYNPNIEDWNWNDIVYSESKLRSVIQEKFVPRLQKSCDLNSAFFRQEIDSDQLIRRSYLLFILSSLGLFTSFITPIFKI